MRRSSVIYTLRHIGLLLYNEMKENMMGWGMYHDWEDKKYKERKVSK
jgi:hypothetical protein